MMDPPGVGCGMNLTKLVNHPPGWRTFRQMQLEGCLFFIVYNSSRITFTKLRSRKSCFYLTFLWTFKLLPLACYCLTARMIISYQAFLSYVVWGVGAGWLGVSLGWSITPQMVGWVDISKGWSVTPGVVGCRTRLVNHPWGWGKVPQGLKVGRCLTRLVNHPPGCGDLRIDMQPEGCLVLFVVKV